MWKQKKHTKLERDFYRQRKRKKPRKPNEIESKITEVSNRKDTLAKG